jgi:hypothetical protein
MRSTRPIDSPHEPHGQASVKQGVAITSRLGPRASNLLHCRPQGLPDAQVSRKDPPPKSKKSKKRTQGTVAPCVKVPGSLLVPAPPWVGSRSPKVRCFDLTSATLEICVRFPNERHKGNQAHPVLKYWFFTGPSSVLDRSPLAAALGACHSGCKGHKI